jgi:hypothetical protein
MRELAGLIANRAPGLLHTKTKDKGTTSGYFGAATQPGLGVFLDTIYDAFKMRRGGIALQYCGRWENAAAESKQISGLVTPRVFGWLLAAAQDVCASA